MDKNGKYKITILGEFADKTLESEFFNYEMSRNAKIIGYLTFVFGFIYMLFFISDYFEIADTKTKLFIFTIRAFFLLISLVFIALIKIINYKKLSIIITLYELLAVVAFFIIINQYEFITILTFFSIITFTLAIYTVPNKIINTTFITIILNILFFLLSAKHISGLNKLVQYKLVAYEIIVFLFCYLGTFLTNYYKRKQYADRMELIRISATDCLTGIYNRAKFNEELNHWIEYCRRYESPLSLVIFDIDDFKKVNDNYGHQIGDHVLQELTITVKRIIRITDIFARWGGEEFVLLLPNTNNEQAMDLTERIRVFVQKNKYTYVDNITCSFGLATLKENENSDSFLKRADQLLYSAKNFGKNIVISESKLCNFSELVNLL